MRWDDVGGARPKMRWVRGEPVKVALVDKSGDIIDDLTGKIGDVITFSEMPAMTVEGAFVADTHGNRRWIKFDDGSKSLSAGDSLELELKP